MLAKLIFKNQTFRNRSNLQHISYIYKTQLLFFFSAADLYVREEGHRRCQVKVQPEAQRGTVDYPAAGQGRNEAVQSPNPGHRWEAG